jgi:hypothetical protein
MEPKATWSTDDELNIDILTITVADIETSFGFTRDALQAIGKDMLMEWIATNGTRP